MTHQDDPRTPAWALRRLLAIVNDDRAAYTAVNVEIAAQGGCWSCLAREADATTAALLDEACPDDATAIAWVERRLGLYLHGELTVDPVDDDELPQWQEDPYPRHWLDDAPAPDDRTPPPRAAWDTRVREFLLRAVREKGTVEPETLRRLLQDAGEVGLPSDEGLVELLAGFTRAYIEDLVAHQGQKLTEARLEGSIKHGHEQAAEEAEEQ